MFRLRSPFMWSLWKEVLLPGRQRDARGNWFDITPEDVRQGYANARRMLSRGVPVPAIWEHLDVEAGDPEEWRARYARHTFAHLADARLNDRGALEVRLDGRDPADRDQALKTKFVSPKVYRGYSDSAGGEYRGTTIAHVAATPTPVQFWQRPFELSQRETLYLSFTPEGAVADDKGGTKESGGGEGGEKKSGLSAIIAALKEKGFNIPDEVTSENELVIAIKAGNPAGGGGDEDMDLGAPEDEYGKPPPGATTGAGGAPMLMSWTRDEKSDLRGRVKNLFHTGRVDRQTARQLLRQIGAVELSFNADGEAVSPVNRRVAELEKKPADSAWSATGRRDAGAAELSDAFAVGHPSAVSGGSAADEVVAEQERLARRLSVKK